eukprot:CAMPEP_0177749878 /NCGR_PEP_ID=MMETSP0484_2-20121128/32725_1 /TAXON_ID=354590 /ORGANISM="Rhodomonas lens, Strain RHODO" /LENGTH=114 /DNA_ID=CAMNT_0019264899 /DNA_START=35 /DNA_END=380 /DNA_ORIENTATION=+
MNAWQITGDRVQSAASGRSGRRAMGQRARGRGRRGQTASRASARRGTAAPARPGAAPPPPAPAPSFLGVVLEALDDGPSALLLSARQKLPHHLLVLPVEAPIDIGGLGLVKGIT